MNILLGLPLGIFRMLGAALLVVLRFLPVVLVLGLGLWLWRKHRRMAKTHRESDEDRPESGPSFTGPVVTVDYREVKEEPLAAEPERPSSFAHKPGWLVFRSRDPRAVIRALGLQEARVSSWTAGLMAVTPTRWFVSPPLGDWVVVVAEGGRSVSQEEFCSLSRRFGEVQAFVTSREKSTYAWSRYRDGRVDRAYGITGGRVFLDLGDWTAEEIALGFGRFPRKAGGPREGFPDESAVLSISAAWGIDPLLEGEEFPAGVGWICSVE